MTKLLKKIVVVGSFNCDMAAFTPHFAADGESVIGSVLKIGPGGKGSNAATAAKRAGGDVLMITKVGADILSATCHNHYIAEGISQKYVFVSQESSTGCALIEISEENGQNRITVIPGANETLTREEVFRAEGEFSECDVVLMQLEVNLSALEAALELAKKYHKTVIFNPAPAKKVPDGFFCGVDYFTPNETEAEFFSGIKINAAEDAVRAGRQLLALGVKNVIITLGKTGAALINDNTATVIPTTDLKPLDTTGAGDSFNGALSVALAEGMDMVTAIKFANCVASLSVTKKGASESMPYRDEIDRLYREWAPRWENI